MGGLKKGIPMIVFFILRDINDMRGEKMGINRFSNIM